MPGSALSHRPLKTLTRTATLDAMANLASVSVSVPKVSSTPRTTAVRSSTRYAKRGLTVAASATPEHRGRRAVLFGASAVAASLASFAQSAQQPAGAAGSEFASPEALRILNREGEVMHSKAEWESILSPAQYRVLREEGTERPWSSPLNDEKRVGTFTCAGCGTPVFTSSAKYNSGTGWPSFYQAIPGAVTEVPDYSIFFMPRTEVRCKKCQGHLGHVFDDGPAPTNMRYCMNGVAMSFVPGA